MTLFDYIVLGVILISIVLSVVRGLVREILSLLGWLLAFVIANRFASVVAAALPELIVGERLRLIVAFGGLFVGTLIVSGILGMLIGLVIRSSGLQLADRGLGGLFGLARGILIVLTAVIIAGWTALPQRPEWRNAMLAPFAEQAVHTLKPYLPGAWGEHVRF
jgi:membrane protein required for colicin V production